MRAGWVNCSVTCAGLAVFGLLAWQLHDDNSRLWGFDRELAATAQENAAENREVLKFARRVTDLGGVPALAAVTFVGALLLWLCGQTRLALFWLLVAGLGAGLNVASKAAVDRPRPGESLRDSAVHERNASFPSGHAMGSTISYGALALVGAALLQRRWAKVMLAILLALLVITICWSRVYLRAHWCSDVVAGTAIGLGWLTLCTVLFRIRPTEIHVNSVDQRLES